MESVIQKINAKYFKSAVVDVRSGDTVKVHQKIREGSKERVQIFQGLVIRTDRKGSHLSRITVRRIASGVGVEKSFLLQDRKSTRLNSSHSQISYAVFCLKKKNSKRLIH